jgi:hypothetical protein
METTLLNIPFELNFPALMQATRLRPGSPSAAELEALCQQAQAIGRPKVAYGVGYIDARRGDSVVVDGVTFTSRMLSRNLAEVERLFPFIVTCGVELEAAPVAQGDMLRGFLWDAIKADVLHAAFAYFEAYLRSQYRLEKIAAMHPGSAEAEVWPIEQQRELFHLLGAGPAAIGVTLSDTYLMSPVKTISGVFFAAQTDFQSCQVCRREDCPSRRAPFDLALWEAARA